MYLLYTRRAGCWRLPSPRITASTSCPYVAVTHVRTDSTVVAQQTKKQNLIPCVAVATVKQQSLLRAGYQSGRLTGLSLARRRPILSFAVCKLDCRVSSHIE